MLFNSFEYLLFLPLVCLGYFLLPFRSRWGWLLAASALFYLWWKPLYGLLLLFACLSSYVAAIRMDDAPTPRHRKAWLGGILLLNFGMLVVFKYLGFLNESTRALATLLGVDYPAPVLNILLPMGISFYTFQLVGYLMDVYWGRLRAERHFGIFLLFITFFPQLVAGPIERAGNLLSQFYRRHAFDFERAKSGLRLLLWGLFKKVVIADRLSLFANQVYNHPQDFGGFSVLLATFFFAFQIYCDFSGYSDIAIGSARILGFDLMKNFRAPYFSKSVDEFWSRWHISLSSWFRDYLYVPLGGNRVPKYRWYINLFVVFFVSGLWHGANWTFVVWGALNGLYLVGGRLLLPLKKRVNILLGWQQPNAWRKGYDLLFTFSLTCLAWVFFRANSVQDAFLLLGRMASDPLGDLRDYAWLARQSVADPSFLGRELMLTGSGHFMTLPFYQLPLGLLLIALLLSVDFWQGRGRLLPWLERRSTPVRYAAYYALILLVVAGGVYGHAEFIYFQF